MSRDTKRSVIQKGCPEINEAGVASAQVNPGYLVKGVSTIAHQTATTGQRAFALALEREELGKGIDGTYAPSGGAGNYYYASGERVKVGVFGKGMQAIVYVASGQNISEDDYLASAGDGTFAETSTVGDMMCRSLENLGAVTTLTKLRVEVL